MQIKEFFGLCHPRFWLLLHKYDKYTDNVIKAAIEKGFDIDEIRATITYTDKKYDYYIWIRNYPYAYGTIHSKHLKGKHYMFKKDPIGEIRPSRLSILRLKTAINNYNENYPEYSL